MQPPQSSSWKLLGVSMATPLLPSAREEGLINYIDAKATEGVLKACCLLLLNRINSLALIVRLFYLVVSEKLPQQLIGKA